MKRIHKIGLATLLAITAIVMLSKNYMIIRQQEEILDPRQQAKGENVLRKKFGIPLIEDNWIIVRADSNETEWALTVRGVDLEKPTHLLKTITYKNSFPVNEVDEFHFSESDTLAYRLWISSSRELNIMRRDSSELIIYFKGKYPPSKGISLSLDQADSILSAWRL